MLEIAGKAGGYGTEEVRKYFLRKLKDPQATDDELRVALGVFDTTYTSDKPMMPKEAYERLLAIANDPRKMDANLRLAAYYHLARIVMRKGGAATNEEVWGIATCLREMVRRPECWDHHKTDDILEALRLPIPGRPLTTIPEIRKALNLIIEDDDTDPSIKEEIRRRLAYGWKNRLF